MEKHPGEPLEVLEPKEESDLRSIASLELFHELPAGDIPPAKAQTSPAAQLHLKPRGAAEMEGKKIQR